jgi:tRNA-2-methylthio-N6-dimethylallyladenosine synthase
LVEGKKKARPGQGRRERWWGRTRTGRLVFFDAEQDWRGRLVNVRITWTGPWSLIGKVGDSQPLEGRSADTKAG